MSSLTTSCPSCGARFRVEPRSLGRHAHCRNCQAVFLVMAADSPPVAPSPDRNPRNPDDWIETTCAACGRVERLRRRAIGKARCTACGAFMGSGDADAVGAATVPTSTEENCASVAAEADGEASDESAIAICTHCGERSSHPLNADGSSRECRKCGHRFTPATKKAARSAPPDDDDRFPALLALAPLERETRKTSNIAGIPRSGSAAINRCPHCESGNTRGQESPKLNIMGTVPLDFGAGPMYRCLACGKSWNIPLSAQELKRGGLGWLAAFLVTCALAAMAGWVYTRLNMVPSRTESLLMTVPLCATFTSFVAHALRLALRK